MSVVGRTCLALVIVGASSAPASAQGELVAEGLVTPKNATSEAEVVLVQLRAAGEVPGPPTVVSDQPRRLVLSTQATTPGAGPVEVAAQSVGRLAPGAWQLASYRIDWSETTQIPLFDGFSTPDTFVVGEGEVYSEILQPITGEGFRLVVESAARGACPPLLDRVSVDPIARTIVVEGRRRSTCSTGKRRQLIAVPALERGRFDVEVRVDLNTAASTVYASGTIVAADPSDPRVSDLRLRRDKVRRVVEIVTTVDLPIGQDASGCFTWRVMGLDGRNHGRDLYADLETQQVRVSCSTAASREEVAVPVPTLEKGHYRLIAQKVEPGGASTELWSQAPRLVAHAPTESLLDGRFLVSVDWRNYTGDHGAGVPVSAASDSAVFSFFDEENWELLVKVLDGCALNDRFWVFSSASTDVEYTLEVEDTRTGKTASYHNTLGQAAPAITDTDALDVCNP